MKVKFYLAIIALLFTAASCSKKPPTDTATSADSSVPIPQDGSEFAHRKPFKYTVTTDIDTAPEEIKILVAIVAINDMGRFGDDSIEYDLDCESDGTYEFIGLTTSNYCTYKRNTGNHQISVRGYIPAMILCASQDDYCDKYCDKCRFLPERDDASYIGKSVISIDEWGYTAWKSMFAFAMNCTALTDIPDRPPNLKYLTDMRYMFYNATSFNQPLEKWDVSNVIHMQEMFYNATSFNQPLEKWNVSKVINMFGMFDGATSFNQPLEKWNVSNVYSMGRMFRGATSFNQPLEKWDVANVTNMSWMFYGATSFNQPLEKWDVKKVSSMAGMFHGATSFNQPLERWNVKKVEDMQEMFQNAKSFNQPLEKWDVAKVKDMTNMFEMATSFSHYPKSWVVPEGKSNNMFNGTKVEKLAKKKPLKTEKR